MRYYKLINNIILYRSHLSNSCLYADPQSATVFNTSEACLTLSQDIRLYSTSLKVKINTIS